MRICFAVFFVFFCFFPSTLKQAADVLAPYITELCNHSLISGHFPAVFKGAFISPIVKKTRT